MERAAQTLGDVICRARQRVTAERDWVALVASIARGDQRALHAFYTETHRIVYTLIVRITGNRETAEEVTLDVYHDVWRRASAYDPAGGPVIGWLMNQARSRAIDRVRFEHRKKRVGTEALPPPASAPANGPSEALDVREQAGLLREALMVLTPDERQVIETVFFSERSYSEAAEWLHQPVGTVKTRIRSGLRKLRHALGEGEWS